MEGDFRRPQPSYRPQQPTDLRPALQPANPPAPQFRPPPKPEPPAQTQPPAESKPTTAELIARHERESKAKPSRQKLFLSVAGLLVVIVGAVLIMHRPAQGHSGPLPSSISASQITIPVYIPKNLPAGFKAGDYKVVKQDVLNYTVTNLNNDAFYVNIQPIPAGYDFNAFNKRFTSPTTYATAIGTATAGIMNNQLICSIPTAKSWVMINTTAIKGGGDMAVIAKSLKPANL